ncbi:cytochrome P450 71A24-like [Prunus yedoensis var. nudiflora]|uniref:Cytochrome P450 71A24-like n=1 Tax=Prunus yedoensis var. nudiflora TaxID=2094558 RepID=A0A314YP96_PRUYE|nr:cytochrome P450 71A24-like [Prunus yedoensis var. nudiflora]
MKSRINKIRASSSSSSSVLNLSKMFVTLSNDVVCRVALGKKYSGMSGGKGGIGFKELLGEASKQLDDFIDKVVQEHMDGGSKSARDDDEQKDFVDVLLGIQQENSAGNFPVDRCKGPFSSGSKWVGLLQRVT